MLPRIILGRLNNVRNLCSIPWTDLIFSACTWIMTNKNEEKLPELTTTPLQLSINKSYSTTCLSNKGWNARFAVSLILSVAACKWVVPAPSGLSSICLIFDSISAKEHFQNTQVTKRNRPKSQKICTASASYMEKSKGQKRKNKLTRCRNTLTSANKWQFLAECYRETAFSSLDRKTKGEEDKRCDLLGTYIWKLLLSTLTITA